MVCYKILFLCLLMIVGTVKSSSSFVGSVSCSDSSSCSIRCSGNSYDLTSIVSSDGGATQRYINSDTGQYDYGFVIPLCGNYPVENDDVDWSTEPSFYISHVWQFDNNVRRHSVNNDYYLGTYVSGSWVAGTYNGAPAFSVSYWNGESCSTVLQRSTTVYIACSNSYSISSPKITVTEPSTCVYEILVQTKEICYLTSSPTMTPSLKPTVMPTSMQPTAPTLTPSCQPSIIPTVAPSVVPTRDPTVRPTAPTKVPTLSPTQRPTIEPSIRPTAPTVSPTIQVTAVPTATPSCRPSQMPSAGPTAPTVEPTQSPSNIPTVLPSAKPTLRPSFRPSAPTVQPSVSCLPTQPPSQAPSQVPTVITFRPTAEPTTAVPTQAPSFTRQMESDRRACTVTSSSSCTLSCPSGTAYQVYDFSSALTVVSTRIQRYYQLSPSSSTTYALVIPMCGTRPSALNGQYVSSDAWKVSTGGFTSTAGRYPLGQYQNDSWVIANFNGNTAFSLNFTSDTICKGTTVYSTTVFLVCNGSVASSSPVFTVLPESSCSYAFTLQSSAFCPSSLIANSTAEVDTGGSSHSSGLTSTGIQWLAVGLVGFFVGSSLSYLAYRKRKRSLHQVYVDIQSHYGSGLGSSGVLPVFIAAPQRLLTNVRDRLSDMSAHMREPVQAEASIIQQPDGVVDVPTADVIIIPPTPRLMTSLGSGNSRDTMVMTDLVPEESRENDREDEERVRTENRRRKSSKKTTNMSSGSTAGRPQPREQRNSAGGAANAASTATGGGGSERRNSNGASAPPAPNAPAGSAKSKKRPVKVPPRVLEFTLGNEQNV